MGASGWMFLLVLAHPGNPRKRAIIWLRVCSLTVILLIWPATSLKIVHLALWTKQLDTPDIHHLTTVELLPVNSESMKNVKCQQLTSALIMSSMDSNLLPLAVPQSWPSDSDTAGITKEFHFASLPIPQPPPRNCSTANMTIKFQFTPLPIPHPLPTKTIHNDVIASVHKLSSWISACLAYLLLWTHCPRNNPPDLTDQWHVDIAENSIRSPLYTVLRIS